MFGRNSPVHRAWCDQHGRFWWHRRAVAGRDFWFSPTLFSFGFSKRWWLIRIWGILPKRHGISGQGQFIHVLHMQFKSVGFQIANPIQDWNFWASTIQTPPSHDMCSLVLKYCSSVALNWEEPTAFLDQLHWQEQTYLSQAREVKWICFIQNFCWCGSKLLPKWLIQNSHGWSTWIS